MNALSKECDQIKFSNGANRSARPIASQSEAQQSADRIRLLCQELATPELQPVLDLSPTAEAL